MFGWAKVPSFSTLSSHALEASHSQSMSSKAVAPVRQIMDVLQKRKRIALRYDPATQTIVAEKSYEKSASSWSGSSFVRPYKPNLRLIHCGRGIEVEVTQKVAIASAFEVFSFDCRTNDFDDRYRAGHCVRCLVSRPLSRATMAGRCAAKKPFYIGALGSKRTHERRCNALSTLGFTPAQTDRIKAPV